MAGISWLCKTLVCNNVAHLLRLFTGSGERWGVSEAVQGTICSGTADWSDSSARESRVPQAGRRRRRMRPRLLRSIGQSLACVPGGGQNAVRPFVRPPGSLVSANISAALRKMSLRPKIDFCVTLSVGVLTSLAIGMLGFGSARPVQAEDSTADAISPAALDHLRAAQRQLVRARVQQKFAVTERGNVSEFDKSLGCLVAAEQESLLAENTGPAAWPELAATTTDIRALRMQIEQLRRTAESWFSGRFPLLRGLALPNFEIDEEPAVIFGPAGRAQRAALHAGFVKNSQMSLPGDLLFGAVLVLPNDRTAAQDAELAELAEAEATWAFNAMPNLTICAGAWQKLPPSPAWSAADEAFIPHCREMLALCGLPVQPKNLVLFVVRETDPGATKDHWIEVQRRVFNASAIAPLLTKPPGTALEAAQMRISEGLCRDRRDLAVGIVAFAAALAALAVVFYGVALKLGRHIVGSWQACVLPPLAGYLIGLGVPLMCLRVVQSIAPGPTASAIDSAWWPAPAGTLALILPGIVMRLAVKSAGAQLADWQIDGHWGLAMVSVALGVGAFWCWPAFVGLAPQSVVGPRSAESSRLPWCCSCSAAPSTRPTDCRSLLRPQPRSSHCLWDWVNFWARPRCCGRLRRWPERSLSERRLQLAARSRSTPRAPDGAAIAVQYRSCIECPSHAGGTARAGPVAGVSAAGRLSSKPVLRSCDLPPGGPFGWHCAARPAPVKR